VYLQAGLADEKLCALVVMGADVEGRKHLLALSAGYRESQESWLEVLRSLRARGVNQPALAVADGALGFWAALPQVWPQTREQTCWLHKTRNILDKLPDQERGEAGQRLRAIHLATDAEAARRLAERLIKDWREAGYERAGACLEAALERLLTFFGFPGGTRQAPEDDERGGVAVCDRQVADEQREAVPHEPERVALVVQGVAEMRAEVAALEPS
jgi:transposase-like protein